MAVPRAGRRLAKLKTLLAADRPPLGARHACSRHISSAPLRSRPQFDQAITGELGQARRGPTRPFPKSRTGDGNTTRRDRRRSSAG